jgi:hypothetical protein
MRQCRLTYFRGILKKQLERGPCALQDRVLIEGRSVSRVRCQRVRKPFRTDNSILHQFGSRLSSHFYRGPCAFSPR